MVDKDAVRNSYDELADMYAAQRSEDGRDMEILEEFLDSLSQSARVLDAGCGLGAPVLARVSESRTAFGADFSAEQLQLAAENAPDASLVQSDITTLPFGPATFDAVIAYWSVIHIPMDDHQTVMNECARVLRPDGRILLCEGTNEWVGENPDWLDSGAKMEWNIAGADTTRDQLLNAGFTIEDDRGTRSALDADRD